MDLLRRHRFGIWVASIIIAIVGILAKLIVPAHAAIYGLLLLGFAYLLAWTGIFFHTDSANAQQGGPHP